MRGWLGTVLRNAARSVARGEARRRGREQESARAESLPAAASVVEEAELAATLAREVQALEEPYRAAIVLVYFEGRTAASIAREFGLPEATVRSHVHRGLQRLRERLAQEREDGRGAWIALLADHAARRVRGGALSSSSIPGAGLLTDMTTKTVLIVASSAAAVLLALFVHSHGTVSTRSTASAAVAAEPLSANETGRSSPSETRRPVDSPLGERVSASPASEATTAASGVATSTGSVLVHVRWADPAAPAKDVSVGVSYRDDPSYLEWREGRCGSDGIAVLDHLRAGPALVRTDRGARAEVEIPAGERVETEIVIPRGIDVSGRVVDAQGQGVAGASIALDWGMNSSNVAAADSTGRFEVRDVRSGQSICARAPGRQPSSLERIEGEPGARVDVSLSMESGGGEVEGIVLDPEGRPIPDALVCVGDERSWQSGGSKLHPAGPRVRTGEDGRFRVEGVSPHSIDVRGRPVGTIPMTARAYGFAPTSKALSLHPGSLAQIEIRLGRGAILEGVVLGEDGAPVPHARILASTESPPRGEPLGCVVAESGEEGRYELDCVPSGEREIHVESKQDGQATERGTLAEGERRRLDLHLSRGIVIQGRLVDARGNGLAGWLVDGNCTARTFKWDEDLSAINWRGYTRSGEDGSFFIPNCPRFEVTLNAFPPGGDGGQPAAALRVEAPPAKDLTFVVQDSTRPTARIRGRLRMTNGAPIPPLKLFASDTDLKSSRATLADIDLRTGEFQVGPLPPGWWALTLESELLCPIEFAPVELEREQDRDVGEIELVPAGFVRASIVHREKGDWKTVRLGLFEEHNRVLYFDLSGTTWKSPPLAPGDQEVVLEIDGKADERRSLVIRSGEETLLEIGID